MQVEYTLIEKVLSKRKLVDMGFYFLILLVSFLLFSPLFETGNDLDNRISKVFLFYSLIPIATILCIPVAWYKPFRFKLPDLFVIILGVYIIINYNIHNSIAITKIELFILIIITYFLFRVITSFSPTALLIINLFVITTGLIESVWGLRQLYGFTSSFHSNFNLTGTFFNPGPYSGYIVTIIPLSLHYYLKTQNKFLQHYFLICFLSIMVVLPATMSRGAWVAGLFGCSFVLFQHYDLKNIIRSFYFTHKKIFISGSIVVILIMIGIFTAIYLLKKDSADGRLVIWKVSSNIIKENPVTGVGYGLFSGAYGDYQAKYFNSNTTNAQEELVADVPEFGFNEFFQITTETGILGLLLYLSILIFAIRELMKSSNKYKIGILSSILTFLIFSCFSYPFSVLPSVILFALLLAECSAINRNKKTNRVFGGIFYTLLIFPIIFIQKDKADKKQAHIKWKNEKMFFNMNIFERTVDNYAELYPLLMDYPAFLFEYGQCLSQTNQFEESNHILKKATILSADPMIYNIMGKNYQALKQFDEAEKHFIKASNMVPNRLYPLYLLALMYNESEQYDKAEDIANIIINKKPKIESPATKEIKREMKNLLEKLIHF